MNPWRPRLSGRVPQRLWQVFIPLLGAGLAYWFGRRHGGGFSPVDIEIIPPKNPKEP